jgi:hypothetical protein
VDDRRDRLPLISALAQLRQQVDHLHGRRDILAGLDVLPESPLAVVPAHQVPHGVVDLLLDERLDHRLFDVPEVHEKLAETPALEFAALCLQRVGEGFWGECPRGDEFRAELGSRARDLDGVHEACLEVEQRLVVIVTDDDQAAGRAVPGQIHQQQTERRTRQVALEHQRPPLRREPALTMLPIHRHVGA